VRTNPWTLRDAVLWWIVLAVCGIAFVLHLNALVRGELAWLPFTLEARSADEPPRIAALRPDLAPADRAALAPGDSVLAAGGHSLRGRGGLTLAPVLYAAADHERRLTLELRRVSAGTSATERVQIGLVPVPSAWRSSVLAISFVAVGAVTLRKAPRRRVARLFFLCAAAYALHWSYFFGGHSEARTWLGIAAFGVGVGLALPLALRAALSFPEDVAIEGGVARIAPWGFAIVGAAAVTWAFGGPLPARLGAPLAVGGSVGFLVCVAAVLVGQWRRTGPIGRRKMKWVLLGAMAAFIPPVLAGSAALAEPQLAWFYEVSLVALALLPLGVFVALARDHLLDVDRLLTATSTTSILAAIGLALVIALVPRTAALARDLVDPSVSQPSLALLAAACLLAARRRMEPWVDRKLFPERGALESGAESLRRELASCEKPAELLVRLGEGLAKRLRLDNVLVYGHASGVFAPLFEAGGALAPAFDPRGPLVSLLSSVGRVLDASTVELWLADDPSNEGERAALEAMGAELLLPIVRAGELEALVCLGSKSSGQSYGASELALLQSIADKASDELRRFDQEQVHRAQEEMCRNLRRYLPERMADRLVEHRDMPSGEVGLSVLFVDLRGSTGIAQQHGPEATFHVIHRFTETVCEEVHRYGGLVVEFQGDGLMAVFGSPDPLPVKEAAALAAARQIVERVRALPIDAADPSQGTLRLGVGIASGPAFVGPLRAVDHTLWGVLGDTPNLAARLEGMAPGQGATIVVDAATYTAAGNHAAGEELTRGFVARRDLPIRGRHGRVDAFILPEGSLSATLHPEDLR
jgi:class 3 adenylate cyclase